MLFFGLGRSRLSCFLPYHRHVYYPHHRQQQQQQRKRGVAKVEWLVMRAMSLKLVKGVMDEVSRLVEVTWVQPRVLDDQQLARLSEGLGEWRGRVSEAHAYVEEQTPELFG